jgi:SAM-dependent methyltransferase
MTTTATPAMMHCPGTAPDLSAIKQRQQATWAAGDFGIIGTTLQIVGETLCEAVDLRAGERVLDVAAGNGNASLAAARRFADVTSTDYVPGLLEDGRRRAAGDRLAITFREADAEALPFGDGSFDVVLSTFGVMFAPDHARAAGELARVCRPGGRIGLASWTPDGFLGALFRTIGRHVPPPAGVASPMSWGSEPHLHALFGASAARIDVVRREFAFRYVSPEHWLDVFRRFYGPTHKAFASLPAPAAAELEADVLDLLRRQNRDGARSLVVPAEYLEVVITRHGAGA